MAKREAVMLAHTFDETKHRVGGWFLSTKLDGLRAIWDGGVTRGMPITSVPFANIAKDRNTDYKSTGLWSRNFKVIRAPEWFLDRLPNIPLDAELWAGNGNWELTASIVKDHIPDEKDWKKVQYHVFDCPSFSQIFAPGTIDTTHFHKSMHGVYDWVKTLYNDFMSRPFDKTYDWLMNCSIMNDVLRVLPQTQLPYDDKKALLIIDQEIRNVVENGGEGLMLRRPFSYWAPERSHDLLKVKKWYDAEATVINYVWGKKTDRGSKLLGKMGTMVVSWDGKIFEVSGFNDSERELVFVEDGASAAIQGEALPGTQATHNIMNPKFPRGSRITFRYRDLTNAGIPKNANFSRQEINP